MRVDGEEVYENTVLAKRLAGSPAGGELGVRLSYAVRFLQCPARGFIPALPSEEIAHQFNELFEVDVPGRALKQQSNNFGSQDRRFHVQGGYMVHFRHTRRRVPKGI